MTLKIVLFVCILGAVVATPRMWDTRIVGGKKASSGQFKHQVSLRQHGGHFCGGSIISSTKILTAAHCVHGVKNPVTVTVGIISLRDKGQSYKVKSMAYHDQYDPNTIENDVAVLTLETPIKYNDLVQPIKLSDGIPSSGQTLTLSGWGQTSEPGDVPDDLQYIDIATLDNDTCAKKLSSSGTISGSNICTTSPKGQGGCKGDSGGPLIDKNGVQVGVVSWGIPCAKGHPDVFASVSYFKKWILSK